MKRSRYAKAIDGECADGLLEVVREVLTSRDIRVLTMIRLLVAQYSRSSISDLGALHVRRALARI